MAHETILLSGCVRQCIGKHEWKTPYVAQYTVGKKLIAECKYCDIKNKIMDVD